MIVVSDTSPLSSLYLIDQLPLLPAIFGKIIVPEKVWEELLVLETDFGRDLSALKSASWLDVVPASDTAAVFRLQRFLDAGESEAIV
jgi:predicted nucleic acid-binding protein